MNTLFLSFLILQCCGIWRPVCWPFGWKTMLYDSYTCLMTFLIYGVMISELVDLFGSFDNVEEFANGSFMLLTMIGVCGKVANLLNKRDEIIALTNVLEKEPCKPRDSEEIEIRSQCERSARFNTMWYAALTGSAVISVAIRSLVVDIPQRTLPYKGWVPFGLHSSGIRYWLPYIHQQIAHAAGASVNIAFDTLVPGLMMQTCAQIKMLKYRLVNIPKTMEERRKSGSNKEDQRYQENGCQFFEAEFLSECVRHHLEIFKFAENTNDLFGHVVFLQYFVSSIVLCVSVFELSKRPLFSSEFAAIILYIACMLVQMFNFCYYSGEITLQSMEICDAVYRMDWSSFSLTAKKSLVTIMIRSLRPITFTCGNIITLSLDSFNKVIKLSYSAYNVLQQSGE